MAHQAGVAMQGPYHDTFAAGWARDLPEPEKPSSLAQAKSAQICAPALSGQALHVEPRPFPARSDQGIHVEPPPMTRWGNKEQFAEGSSQEIYPKSLMRDSLPMRIKTMGVNGSRYCCVRNRNLKVGSCRHEFTMKRDGTIIPNGQEHKPGCYVKAGELLMILRSLGLLQCEGLVLQASWNSYAVFVGLTASFVFARLRQAYLHRARTPRNSQT